MQATFFLVLSENKKDIVNNQQTPKAMYKPQLIKKMLPQATDQEIENLASLLINGNPDLVEQVAKSLGLQEDFSLFSYCLAPEPENGKKSILCEILIHVYESNNHA